MNQLFKKGISSWNKGIHMWKNKSHPKGMLGKAAWNKGKKMSKEAKEKNRLAQLGRIHSEETKAKMSSAHKGRKNSKEHSDNISKAKKLLVKQGKHNWGDGTRSKERARIYNSREYINWRIKVFKRDNYKCQTCNKVGGYLEAHHIKPFSLFPNLRFDINNGVTLCKSCHIKTDTYGAKIDKIAAFTEIPIPEPIKKEFKIESIYPKQDLKPKF